MALLDYKVFFSIAFSLFLLMDPIGNVPLYVALLKELEPKRQRVIIIRELFIALFVILAFTFFGRYFLQLLGISAETISISGGIILFIIAMRMIFPKANGTFEELKQEEPFIVPLAIPLIAGPSVLATVMIYTFQHAYSMIIGAIIIAWIASFFILISAPFLKKILGSRGVAACERLMGLLLTLIAVEMFLSGLKPIIGVIEN